MNPYLDFVYNIAKGIDKAKKLEVSGTKKVVDQDRKVLLFSPHPDDECITGLLPYRLQHELNAQIINVPMTFGSNIGRRKERLEELNNACAYLGWENLVIQDDLENLTYTDVIAILETFKPYAIFFPHDKDWNSRHVEVHHNVMAALKSMPKKFSTLAIETEYWGGMDTPNANVEANVEQVADLVAATSLHTKEVERNAYHLTLPAWMQNNVRRGAELVGGQGKAAPNFTFSTLYRIQTWNNGTLLPIYDGGRCFFCGAGSLKIVDYRYFLNEKSVSPVMQNT